MSNTTITIEKKLLDDFVAEANAKIAELEQRLAVAESTTKSKGIGIIETVLKSGRATGPGDRAVDGAVNRTGVELDFGKALAERKAEGPSETDERARPRYTQGG